MNGFGISRQASAVTTRSSDNVFPGIQAGGVSALVTGQTGTMALLVRTRTRVLRIRPPLDLPSVMDQLAAAHQVLGGMEVEQGLGLLTAPDATCDQIVLVVEGAASLSEPALRYIEQAVRMGPHLQVVFAGRTEAASLPALEDFNELRERLLLSPVPPTPRPASAAQTVTSLNPPRAAWTPPRRDRGRKVKVALAGAAGGLGLVLLAVAGRSVLTPGNGSTGGWLTMQVNGIARPDTQTVAPPAPHESAAGDRPGAAVPTAGLIPSPITAPALLDKPRTADTAAAPQAVPPEAPLASASAGTASSASTALVSVVLKPTMIALPGATFRMGSGDDRSERPAHPVAVRRFSIAEHATTVREWQECVRAGACNQEATGKPQNPVTNISWDDARRYTEWLSGVTGQHYRLPTEAEWEYAARGGTTTHYAWGDAMLPGKSGCKGCGVPAELQNPPWVGAYPANPFALYGMGGGVAEWVVDCWHRDYQGAPADGSVAWAAPDCQARVLRGGSWMEEAAAVRPASRESYDASVRYPTHGFRVALSE
jgi:formylglycine-generating enzyme required for sulfatase activity